MDLEHRVGDWEVAGVTNLGGGGAAIYAGGWLFMFRSRELRVEEPFVFMGYGLGVGASVRGVPVSGSGTVSVDPRSFTPVGSRFSLSDLHGAGGRLTSASISFMLGWGITYITAFGWNRVLFESLALPGFTAGVSVSANSCAGLWSMLRFQDRRRDVDARVSAGQPQAAAAQ